MGPPGVGGGGQGPGQPGSAFGGAPGFLAPGDGSGSNGWDISGMIHRWLQSPATVAAVVLGSLLAVGGVLWYLGVLVL
eukprot:g7637.t1